MSFICSFEVINVVIRKAKSKGRPDQNIFSGIASFVADSAAVNPNCIKPLLANDLSAFFIKGERFFSNGTESLARNSPYCPISYKILFSTLSYS